MNISPHTYSPLSDEYVTPAQLHHAPVRGWQFRLAFAVLEEAIASATVLKMGGSATRKAAERIQREAREWIACDDHTTYVLTFVDVCEALGLEPETLRKGVLREGFRLPTRMLRNGMVVGGQVKQTTVQLLTRIDLKEQRKARRVETHAGHVEKTPTSPNKTRTATS